ncbi:hypothetical protein BC629DRAFT_1531022 [Irpex lacteus]|nr:hypothetical protein BC629DRAFT_1531022 [Irpex lacteus]
MWQFGGLRCATTLAALPFPLLNPGALSRSSSRISEDGPVVALCMRGSTQDQLAYSSILRITGHKRRGSSGRSDHTYCTKHNSSTSARKCFLGSLVWPGPTT